MFSDKSDNNENLIERLSAKGFWSAQAAKALDEKKYSKAVSISKENLKEGQNYLSGKIIYARALYHSGQIEKAEEIFGQVLSEDQNNIAALKYLGDIRSSKGNDFEAELFYSKIFLIDPKSSALSSSLDDKSESTTKTITIKRKEETQPVVTIERPGRKIPFYTETMGDLYLAQGFPNLAYEVFKKLSGEKNEERIINKLKKAEDEIKEKEKHHVKKTD